MAPVNPTLPLTAFKPDNADMSSGFLKIARGCIKKEQGYGPAPSLIQVSDEILPDFADVDALFVGTDTTSSNVYRTYAGNKSEIYEALGTPFTWTDVSKAGGYTTQAEERWRTAQFDENLFATNGNDPLQFVSVPAGGLYADVGATGLPLAARYIAVISDEHLVLGNLIVHPTLGTANNGLQWSPFRNPFGDWTDIATRADASLIPNVGEMTGLTGGEFGTALFRKGVVRIDYTPGASETFQRNTISREVGCDVPASVLQVGHMTIWWSGSGWYAYNGNELIPIGREWVDKWTRDELRAGQEFRIQPAYDAQTRVARWLFTGQQSQGDVPNRCLIWKPSLGQRGFTYQDIDAYALGDFIPPGTTLDANPYPTLDADLPPLDDPFWTSGTRTAGAIDAEGKVATFNGSPADAVFTWAEGQLAPAAQRVQLNAALPITEGGAPTISVAQRNVLNDPIVPGVDVTPQPNGDIPLRTNARYQTITMKQTGDWTSATALQLDGVTTGTR